MSTEEAAWQEDSAEVVRRRSLATSEPPPPPPMPVKLITTTTEEDLPVASRDAAVSIVPGPPPPRHQTKQLTNGQAAIAEEDDDDQDEELPSRRHAESIAPPPPTRQPSAASPPGLARSSDDDSGGEEFDFEAALNASDSHSGEDDSDVDSAHLHEGSSMSTDDPSILATQVAGAGKRMLPGAKKQSTSRAAKTKLSFTAPTDSSPISGEPSSSGGAGAPGSNEFQVVAASDGVSLSSLSTQIALHMELANFAHQRKKSIIMSGAQGNSLIPQLGAVAGVPATAAASGAAAAAAPRRTNNIRSMSLSLAGQTNFLSSLPLRPGVGPAPAGPGLGPSPAFAAVRAQIGQQIRSAASEERRRKRKPRGDESVLDLFGDQANTAAATTAAATAPAAAVAATSATPASISPTTAASARAGGKRRSIFTPAHPMPDIDETSSALSASAPVPFAGAATIGATGGARRPSSSTVQPTTPRSNGATPLASFMDSGEYPPAAAVLNKSAVTPTPAPAAGATTPKQATPLANLITESGEFPPANVPAGGKRVSTIAPSAAVSTPSTPARASILSTTPASPLKQQPMPFPSVPSNPSELLDLSSEEGDDVTSLFLTSPPAALHVSKVFPFRKVLRAPLRVYTCLQQPSVSGPSAASLEQLEQQYRMLSFLLESFRSTRMEFRQLCLDALRNENASLRELLVVQASSDLQAGKVLPESQQKDSIRRALKRVGQHAEWNTALHDAATHAQLTLEDLRRRVQLHLPAEDELMVAAAVSSLSPPPPEPSHASAGNNFSHLPPGHSTRPRLSLGEIAARAKTFGTTPSSNANGPSSNLATQSSRDLRSPVTPGGGAGQREYPSADGSSSASSAITQAQLQRFHITKINRIRKNTPRILEIDLTTRTMVICKQSKSSGKGEKEKAEEVGGEDGEFTNRDIVISPSDLVSAELHGKNELQLELSFLVHSSTGGIALQAGKLQTQSSSSRLLTQSSTSNLLSPGKSKDAGGGGGSSGRSSTVKNWKVLFTSRAERERFHRLLQVTLLTPEASSNAAAASSNGLPSGAPRLLPFSSTSSGSGSSSSGSSLAHDEAPVSTQYPSQLAGGGGTTMQTYCPRAPALSSTILSQVRLLPLLPLASSLHTIWCLRKKALGFKYGLKLVSGTGESARKTHPYLVPFHSLPLARRDYNLKVVTATLATVLALGYQVRKPWAGEETVQEGKGKVEKQPQASNQQGGGNTPTAAGTPSTPNGSLPAAPASTPGSISPDLLSHVDLFAESAHDLWSSEKLHGGWRYAPMYSMENRTHPGLVPYGVLGPAEKEKERNQAYKILGTLVEYGYELVKVSGGGGAMGGAGGNDATVSSTPLGTVNSSSQPVMGSLRRPLSTIGVGPVKASPMMLNSQTFAPPT